MTEKVIEANGIELWAEDFGDPADPAVLLVMGAEAQGIMWPVALIEQIVVRGRYVIRYDNRDVGQSSVFDFDINPYTLDEMAEDAIGILDHYRIDKAHVAGASMGGMITQLLMIRHPERLLSATVIMSSPLSGNADDKGMPQLFDATLPKGPFLDDMGDVRPKRAPTNREDYVTSRVEMFAALGDPSQVDREGMRQGFEVEFDRARDINSKANHALAIGRSSPADRRPLLANCTIPTTVIHGENDPILPLAHGQAVADAVPGAVFHGFGNMAHDMPPHCWPSLIESVT